MSARSRLVTVLFPLLMLTLAACGDASAVIEDHVPPDASIADEGDAGHEPPEQEDAGEPEDAGVPDAGVDQCFEATQSCDDDLQCCSGLSCGHTSLGQVCCGGEGASCATANGEDCCGNLLCVDGKCGYQLDPGSCSSPCTPAPALLVERKRLDNIGGSFLGICGDANHTYGYHVPAAKLPSSDYSLQGPLNVPVCDWNGCAIDIGMDWPASRDWLRWLIQEIRADRIQGIAEVIGSYDGTHVRYWSDSSGWSTDGVAYQGSGHDTWTHVAIYRSTTLDDHHLLFGWTANGQL